MITTSFSLVSCVLAFHGTVAGQAWFRELGAPTGACCSGALDVSGDGGFAVGAYVKGDGQLRAFRWTPDGGCEDLGMLPGYLAAAAWSVSADGSAVVGQSEGPDGTQAFRWSAQTGMEGLGFVGGNFSSAEAASQQGDIVVGTSGGEPFMWTAETGMVGLGLPGAANDVSADGTVIVGGAEQAFRWTAENGFVWLGDLPGGPVASVAVAVSSGGETAVGFSRNSPDGWAAFRWTAATGMVELVGLPGESACEAHAVSADGSVVVGVSFGSWGEAAVVWDGNRPAVRLYDALLAAGATDVAGWDLWNVSGISNDGSIAVGYGPAPDTGEVQAWMARLPRGCYADINSDGMLDLFDLLAFANHFNANNPSAECDGDLQLTLFDFLCFVNAFNGGC
jgi:uncharacterized membrane protein